MFPDDLTPLSTEQLYDLLDELQELRRRYKGKRSEEASQVRAFCSAERPRVQRELKARDKPATRPGDDRVYGPGCAAWQRAGG